MPPIDEPGSHPVGLNPVFSIPQIYEAILKNLPVGFSLVDRERERKNFLSMLVHDMKNPIVIGEGFLNRLLAEKAGPLTEKQEKYLSIIREETAKLQRIVADFLDFSRFERNEYQPAQAPYNLEEALGRRIEAMRVVADKKDLHLFLEYDQESLPIIFADAAMIDRVISNLLDNAVKYTEPGGAVTVRLVNRTEDILVEFSDTGIGIQPEDLPCVFDAFCRIDKKAEDILGLAVLVCFVPPGQSLEKDLHIQPVDVPMNEPSY